jgi:hypothetical protein
LGLEVEFDAAGAAEGGVHEAAVAVGVDELLGQALEVEAFEEVGGGDGDSLEDLRDGGLDVLVRGVHER